MMKRMLIHHLDEIVMKLPFIDRNRFETDVVPVDITNAAKWFYEDNEQDEHDWTESFPKVVPPWPVCWFEFRTPSFINVGGKITTNDFPAVCTGVLATTLEIKEDKRRSAIEDDMLSALIFSQYPHGELTRQLRDPLVQEAVTDRQDKIAKRVSEGWMPRWITFFKVFILSRSKMILDLIDISIYISEDGRVIPDLLLHVPGLDIIPTLISKPPVEGRDFLTDLSSSLLPVLFSLSLLHCKNVEIINEPRPSKKVLKARQKRGKPYLRYKQLIVDPMRKQTRHEAESGESSIKRALHICRGHFKDYRDGEGLFGKYKDIYWWDMHARGDKALGEIKKSYKVVRKKDAP